MAPTCRSTTSFQSRLAPARQEPHGVEMLEEPAIARLPPSSRGGLQRGGPCRIPAQPQAGSWHLPGAGGRRGQVLPPSQAPRRGNSDPEPTERCFLCVSTMLWFGGLAASLELEGFLGPLLNIHLLVKKPAQLKLPALSSCQSGGPPSQKIPPLDQIAVAGVWRHSFHFLPAPPSPPGSMHFSTARFWKQLTLGCKKPRVRMEASTPSSAKAGCHLPGDTWVTCRVTAPEHLPAGRIPPCTASSRGWGTH